MISKATKFMLILMMLCGIVLVIHPQLDITLARFFWNKEQGFLYGNHWIAKAIYNFIPVALWTIGGLAALYLAISFFKLQKFPNQYQRQAVFLVLCLLLGPCLITNFVFKDHWGRARPFQVEEFGGTKQFTPALVLSDQCRHNCSFIAGHPSGGFYFFALAMLVAGARRRRKYEIAAILFGLSVGFVRLIQGKHFVSDTIFAGLVNISVILVVYYFVLYRRKAVESQDPGQEAVIPAY